MARISLDRPAVLNAYNIQMRDDFSEALSAVADDPEVRALLITGEGRGFCAGADLTEFGSAPSQIIARQVRWQRDVWGQMISMDKPIVVAIHGFCIGSGLEIALLGDLRLAAHDTIFAMPEVQPGYDTRCRGNTDAAPQRLFVQGNGPPAYGTQVHSTGGSIDGTGDSSVAAGAIERSGLPAD